MIEKEDPDDYWVDEDDLDWDEDVSVYEGAPYSGRARQFFPDGSIKRELVYVDGFGLGRCREWYPSGRLRREWNATRGVPEGEVREWHENGSLKSVSLIEFGAEVRFTAWNSAGDLVANRELSGDSELMRYIEQRRREQSS